MLPAHLSARGNNISAAPISGGPPPIIFVTGLTGSSLYSRPSASVKPKSCGPHFFCSCADEHVWVGLKAMLPFVIDCTLFRLAMGWNSTTKSPLNVDGFETYTKGYGASDGAGFPDPIFEAVRTSLVAHLGYPADQSAFSDVVFDFRLGHREWAAPPGDAGASGGFETGDLARFQAHVEQRVNATGAKAIIVSVSEGGVLTQAMLASVTAEWKAAHLLGWASVSTPFAGGKEIGFQLLSGDAAYKQIVPWLDLHAFRDATQAWPGMAAVAPLATGLVPEDEAPFILTPSTNYSIRTFADALARAGRAVAADIYRTTLPARRRLPLTPPGVPTLCMRGTGVPSIAQLTYKDDGMSDAGGPPVVSYDARGDGTVHYESLAVCERWPAAADGGNVEVKVYHNVTHVALLTHAPAITDLLTWIWYLMPASDP